VPDVPENRRFQIGPTLARRAPEEEAGELPELLPSLERRIRRGEELTVMTRICRVGRGLPVEEGSLDRILTAADGSMVWSGEPVEIAIDPEGRVGCQLIVDRIGTSALPPGEYSFMAGLHPSGTSAPVSGDSFTLVP
jgi:hypothetical protein